MDWEKFKGFCRRQTQKVNENYRHAERTNDPEADSSYQRIVTYRRVAMSCASRIEQLQQNIANSVALLEGVKEDLKLIKSTCERAVQAAVARESGVVALDEDQGDVMRCVEFERIKGGKPFNTSLPWFQQMLSEIGQPVPMSKEAFPIDAQ